MNGILELPTLGVIRAVGPDAAAFLHGQLSNDVQHLAPGSARLAAYCSPQGRMLASFIIWHRAPEEFLLVCASDLLPATLKRLSMFVLRAKAKLSDATPELAIYGVAADRAPDRWPATTWHQATLDHQADVIALPGSGTGTPARWLLVQPREMARPALPALDTASWQWLDVMSGVAMVTQAIREQFVPQMLNYESVGGVDFHKGCYPGQEVVARSQFRGTLKRRAFIVHANTPLSPANEIYGANDPGQPAGIVASGAPAPDGGWDAIAVLKVSAATASLTLGSPTGVEVSLKTLPYVLATDI